MAIASWRLPQPQGDQFRLGGSVQQFGSGRRRPFLAHQGGLEALQDELPPHVLHGPNSTAHGLADLLVIPTRTVHVRLEQDDRSPQLLRLAFLVLDRRFADCAFLVGEPNNILLVHGNLLMTAEVLRNRRSWQPQDLDWTGHYEGRGYQVTWALGHLVTLKEPQDYDPALKHWSLETLPFVPEQFGLKPLDEKGSGKQLAVVRRLFRAADELICATDAGREGGLIFRYILELTGCIGKPARRLWLSSLTREAIRDAFARLRPLSEYDALYAAARCRSEADWIVGLNATRYYTVRHRSTGHLWSVGRVQTPVLAMIVRRDDEIRAFKPEPFWELLTLYRKVTFKFAGDRFAQEEEARAVLARVEGHPFTVRGVEKKPERVPPPQLYDLTELQRDMNRRFGMSADAP